MTLGERILILRRRAVLSQAQLGRACGLTLSTIARLEQGRILDLSGEAIVRMARVLCVTTDTLLGVVDLGDAPRAPLPTAASLQEPGHAKR